LKFSNENEKVDIILEAVKILDTQNNNDGDELWENVN
jgi:hypothetical protein